MYIELHSRSAFSFLEGASLPENLVAACANLNMPAMALLDRNGVYGSPRFHLAAKKARIKAHLGAEVHCQNFSPQNHRVTEKNSIGYRFTIAKDRISHRQFEANDSSGAEPSLSGVEKCLCDKFALPLLVSSRLGYQNLCRLITKMKLRAAKGEG